MCTRPTESIISWPVKPRVVVLVSKATMPLAPIGSQPVSRRFPHASKLMRWMTAPAASVMVSTEPRWSRCRYSSRADVFATDGDVTWHGQSSRSRAKRGQPRTPLKGRVPSNNPLATERKAGGWGGEPKSRPGRQQCRGRRRRPAAWEIQGLRTRNDRAVPILQQVTSLFQLDDRCLRNECLLCAIRSHHHHYHKKLTLMASHCSTNLLNSNKISSCTMFNSSA